MKFYSTNHDAPAVNFRDATLAGQAPDKGLYFPEQVPEFPEEAMKNAAKISREELALMAIQPYVGATIPAGRLTRIVEETISFDFPLVKVNEKIFSLELFHGPTLAFKDVGARFMSRCLGYFVEGLNRKITVLVATSGDTGGAVANGFYGVDGVDVVILYPSGKVSEVQERQLTTLGKNIKALEVDGSFDDCQRMVKTAFADAQLRQKVFLTSANSINVARWLPQQFYYLFAWQEWADKNDPPVIAVPSGNFGNICAGMLAAASGMPVKHFIAACNANDAVPEFLRTGTFRPRPTKHTISNAMDVGHPSNFIRILELFKDDHQALKQSLSACSVSDDETRKAIREVYHETNYLLDPHGAVGYIALQQYLEEHPHEKGYFLETAHPVKFPDAIENIIGCKLTIPDKLAGIMHAEKVSTRIKPDDGIIKDFLLQD